MHTHQKQRIKCRLPLIKQRKAMLTEMRHAVAPWVVKAARATTTTELASLTTCFAFSQAWHSAIEKRLLEPEQAVALQVLIC